MSKRAFPLALALLLGFGLARPLAAQIGEEVDAADRSAEVHEHELERHRAEMERHRAEMEHHAREMREALMRAHGDSGSAVFLRRSGPDERFLYTARVRESCARMGIAFTGDDTIAVAEVMPGSGADDAGVRAGDVILSVNGERATQRTMMELAEGLEADDQVRLVVRRDGREQTIDVTARGDVCPLRTMLSPEPFRVMCMKRDSAGHAEEDDGEEECAREFVFQLRESLSDLHENFPMHVFTESGDSGMRFHFEGPDGERSIIIDLDSMRLMADSIRMLMPSIELDMREAEDAARAHAVMIRSLELGARALAGAHLTELNDDLAAYFDADEGVLVTRVEDDTPAARAGLLGGDVIVEVNGEEVDDIGELRAAAARADGAMELGIVRQGERRTVRLAD